MPVGVEDRVLANLVKHMHKEDEDPLTPLIDDYLTKRNRSENRLTEYTIDMRDAPRPPGRFSPSTICGCERQAAFKFLGVPGRRVIDPEEEIVFDDGKWRHHRWQATFLDMQEVLGRNVFEVLEIEGESVIEDIYVAGSLDALVKIHGKRWVIDFKGANMWAWEYVYKNHTPIELHVKQLLSYMKAKRCKRGMLFYEQKDKNRVAIFIVRFSAEQFREVEQWCERVVRKMDNHKLPPKSLECKKGRFVFEKCPWTHLCYGATPERRVEIRAYRGFDGVERQWKAGLEAVRA